MLAREEESFREYVAKLRAEFKDEELSYFELNLETWRQLWRVLEISDVLCLVMDVRFAPLHFPPPLFDYCKSQGKRVFLILNKCDLVGEPTTTAWKDYFEQRFPGIEVFVFASFRTATSGNPAARRKAQRVLTVPVGLSRLVNRWAELGLQGAESWKRKLLQRGMEGLEVLEPETGHDAAAATDHASAAAGSSSAVKKSHYAKDRTGRAHVTVEDVDAEEAAGASLSAADAEQRAHDRKGGASGRKAHQQRKGARRGEGDDEAATEGAGAEADTSVAQHPLDAPATDQADRKKFITIGKLGILMVGIALLSHLVFFFN